MDQLVKIPNRVAQRQREMQNSTKPLYFRSPRSNLYLGMWYTGFTIGILGISWGTVQLIKGQKTS